MRATLLMILPALLVPALVSTAALAAGRDVPYWAAMRADEVNMRVGPGEDYRIKWVYRRRQLPTKVVRIKEGWRLIEDPDGAQGWVLARFLTLERGAIVTSGEPAEMREKAGGEGKLLWRLQPGVTGQLGDCAGNWCRFDIGLGRKGYVPEQRLWGSGEP